MQTKAKSNFSNMEQKEALVMKPADKKRAVAILSTGYYQSTIMQHLLDENTFKKLDS